MSSDEQPGPRRLDIEPPAAEELRDKVLSLIVEHERKTVAARALAGDPNPTDADPLDYLHWIADEYARHKNSPDDLNAFLDRLADELTLDDVRALRKVGEAATAVTPRVILAADTEGIEQDEISRRLGMSVRSGYVARILREQRDT